jgi:hypothetical protein
MSKVWLDRINPSAPSKQMKLPLIRIGCYAEGETIDAAVAINDGVKPPPFCNRLRTQQRWFSIQIRNILSSFLNKDDRLGDVEQWVKMNELDDSLIYHYNLQSVTDLKQPLTVTMPLVTATPSGGEGHDGNNKEESTTKYEAGPNYSRSHPKMKNIVTPAAVKIRDALSVILSRGLTINVTVDNIMDDADYSDDDNDDDASYYDDPQTHGSEYNEDFAKEYPLLSRFALPLFNTGDDDPFKRAACTRSNMLRELVGLMGSCGDEIKFESLNSRHTTKLLPVGSKPMQYAPDIMTDVKDFLIAQESSYGDEEIARLCEDCVEYLVLWDAAFAAVHVDHPDQDACDKAQLYIDLAMSKHRELKFRVTPKTHGMEKHIVCQMLRVKIIGKLIEHWVEHYHQIGGRYDMKWISQPDELRKAVIRARREFTASHPEVLKRIDIITKSLRKRKTPEATLAAAAERKRVKTELRKKYVDAAIVR